MIVGDCSFIADLVLGHDLHEAAGEQLHAPAHLDIEMVSALWGLVLGRHIASERAHQALEDYTALDIRIWHIHHPRGRL